MSFSLAGWVVPLVVNAMESLLFNPVVAVPVVEVAAAAAASFAFFAADFFLGIII